MDAVNGPVDVYRVNLGAYVLGALDGPERAELEAHLATCPECRAELVELAGLPGLLRQVTLDEVTATTPAAGDVTSLADRALSQLRERRRAEASVRARRRRTGVLTAAAGFALVGVLLTGVVRGWFEPGTTLRATDTATHVSAAVQMVDSEAGTRLSVRLKGVPEHQKCLLVAVGLDGTRQNAAAWTANYEGEADVEGSTWMRTWRMAALEVVTPEGKTLLRVPVTS